ncbi:MAG: NADH:flavin oxidoreductase/NADH oxidase family protein [Parvularculaceae bacterium]|nr:NADH:flavin oxidoreductase/NADH oxidase family protein [Parvularculaceae bacterium]
MTSIADSFTLPCGAVLKNRLAKAAMTEQLAEPDGKVNAKHVRLYTRWAEGGAGLLITGNVQVDRKHLEHPGNVVIEGNQSGSRLDGLRAMAEAAQTNGTKVIMQISHAGRQTPKAVNPTPLAPSAVSLGLPGGTFGSPRSMTAAQLGDIETRFAHAAKVAAEAGYDGVQIHAAHGYLLSSFLNPRANVRQDPYGGSLENRAKLLLRIVERVRAEAPEGFIVSVKLNSSDFQKGGLSTEDSLIITEWLAERGVDLLEISGGNYEQPAMMDLEGLEKKHEENKAESTKKREAYFLAFAEAVRAKTNMPLMVTGGFRSRAGMDEALTDGACDVVGIARPLCVQPNAPSNLLDGTLEDVPSYEKSLRIGPGLLGPQSPIQIIKVLNGFSNVAFFYRNIELMGDGKDPTEKVNILWQFIRGQRIAAKKAKALT